LHAGQVDARRQAQVAREARQLFAFGTVADYREMHVLRRIRQGPDRQVERLVAVTGSAGCDEKIVVRQTDRLTDPNTGGGSQVRLAHTIVDRHQAFGGVRHELADFVEALSIGNERDVCPLECLTFGSANSPEVEPAPQASSAPQGPCKRQAVRQQAWIQKVDRHVGPGTLRRDCPEWTDGDKCHFRRRQPFQCPCESGRDEPMFESPQARRHSRRQVECVGVGRGFSAFDRPGAHAQHERAMAGTAQRLGQRVRRCQRAAPARDIAVGGQIHISRLNANG
jgi:hypothetical protein